MSFADVGGFEEVVEAGSRGGVEEDGSGLVGFGSSSVEERREGFALGGRSCCGFCGEGGAGGGEVSS